MTKPWEGRATLVEEGKKKKPWEGRATLVEQKTSTFEDYVRGFGGGSRKGMAQMAGAPVDITNAILGAIGLPVSERPVGGSRWIKETLGERQFPSGPDTTGGRIVERIGEEIGASALPAGMIMRSAKTAAPAMRGAPTLKDTFLDPIRRAPGRAAIGETAAAAGAGAGAGVAREIAPDSPGAEMTGQLIGGLAPTVAYHTPSGLAMRGGRALASRFSPAAQRQKGLEAVQKVMGEAVDPSTLERGLEVAKRAPEFKPSVAELTGSPTLIRQQQEVEKTTGPFLEWAVQRRVDNQKAIERFSNAQAPVGDVNVSFVMDTAKNRVDVFGERVTATAGRNLQQQRDLAAKLPTIDRISSGKVIRDAIYEARSEAMNMMSMRANQLGINDADITQAFMDWRGSLPTKFKTTSKFEEQIASKIYNEVIDIKGMKGEPTGLLDTAGQPILREKPAEVIRFNDVKAIRERITDEILDLSGAAVPNTTQLRYLRMFQKDLDDFLDTMGGQFGDNYRQFRREYYENVVTPFEQGAIFKSRSKDGTGFFRTQDEKLARMFLDNESAARQFKGIFGKDPEMMKHMQSAILDDLREAATVDGLIDEKRMTSWLRKNNRALNELPEVKGAVSSVANAQEALLTRQAQLGRRRMNIENMALAKQLTKYGTEQVSAEKILTDALNKPGNMARLHSLVRKDPDALGALRRTVWERAVSGSSEDTLKFLGQHEKSLKVIFGVEHFNNITDISVMKAMTEAVPTPQGVAFQPKPFEQIEKIAGIPLPQAATRYYALKTGRLSKSYLVAEIARASLFNRAKIHAEEVFRQALYDPEIARQLAASIRSNGMNEKTARRLGARYFALGLPYLRDEDETE